MTPPSFESRETHRAGSPKRRGKRASGGVTDLIGFAANDRADRNRSDTDAPMQVTDPAGSNSRRPDPVDDSLFEWDLSSRLDYPSKHGVGIDDEVLSFGRRVQ